MIDAASWCWRGFHVRDVKDSGDDSNAALKLVAEGVEARDSAR